MGSGGFSAAPTLVEAQREALTDRLRREFGLFLSDDEEHERIRRNSSGVSAGSAPPTTPGEPIHFFSLCSRVPRGNLLFRLDLEATYSGGKSQHYK